MIQLRPSGHALRMRGAYLFTVTALAISSCVDNAYDLGDISLKMTLGAEGITFPLGKIEKHTVDSLIKDKNIKNLITEDGVYAYKLDSTINETIEAITIDPIRDVIPAIEPYHFSFSESSLPETFRVEGMSSRTTVGMPSLGFGNKPLEGVSISRPLRIDNYMGITLPAGTALALPSLDERDDLTFTVDEIPNEIASVRRLWFGGSEYGTPIRVRFSLGALSSAVAQGTLSFELDLPQTYVLRLVDTYGGAASVAGSTLRVNDYPLTSDNADFVFYLAERAVSEPITAVRAIDIRDELHYAFSYTGVSNGDRVPAGEQPVFSLDIAPAVADAEIVTERITPDPTDSAFDVPIEVDGLTSVSRIDYVAFTNDVNNVLVLSTVHTDIPLQGDVDVRVCFPDAFVFASGVAGLSANVLTTTLDRLSAPGGVRLPLEGIRFTGSDGMVTDGLLKVDNEVTATITPDFPSAAYRLSELVAASDVVIDIAVHDTELRIDPQRCELVVGFSEMIDVVQEIGATFSVPDEVAGISLAEVRDANTGATVMAIVSLGIENMPVDNLYFDHIDITLPAFLDVECADYDSQTHSLHIDRVKYQGGQTVIACIPVLGVKDVPVRSHASGKIAELTGEVRIHATVNVPDGTEMDGIVSETITLLPEVSLPPLEVVRVNGSVDLDLQEYLEPTTIDLGEIRESLGDQNIEINLVAPQIALEVSNPVGIAMIGDIVLQPYDFSDAKLDVIVIRDVYLKPAVGDNPRITRLYVTDGTSAPAGYTLCRVADLSNLVKIIPSKIDVEFDLHVDDTQEQSFTLTGEDYPFDVRYSIRIPLQFKEGGAIDYTDTEDVSSTFDDMDNYEITAEDILITLDARSTLPLALNLSADFLDAMDKPLSEIVATVSGRIEGYDSASGSPYRGSQIDIRMNIQDGDIRHLKKIEKISYHFTGSVVGSDAALTPDQYISADMKLILKKGITFDLEDFFSDEDNDKK